MMKPIGIFFSVIFVALIFAPGVVAWFLSLHGFVENESPTISAPIIQFPSQNVVEGFPENRKAIDAA
jgi:hypothetical protein